jgi:hypothetical protein
MSHAVSDASRRQNEDLLLEPRCVGVLVVRAIVGWTFALELVALCSLDNGRRHLSWLQQQKITICFSLESLCKRSIVTLASPNPWSAIALISRSITRNQIHLISAPANDDAPGLAMVGILRAVAAATRSRRSRLPECAALQEDDPSTYGAFDGSPLPDRIPLPPDSRCIPRQPSLSSSSTSSSSCDFPSFSSFRRQHIVAGTLACTLLVCLFFLIGTLAWPGRGRRPEDHYPHPVLLTHFLIGAASWLASDALRKPLFQAFPQPTLASEHDGRFFSPILRSLPHVLLARCVHSVFTPTPQPTDLSHTVQLPRAIASRRPIYFHLSPSPSPPTVPSHHPISHHRLRHPASRLLQGLLARSRLGHRRNCTKIYPPHVPSQPLPRCPRRRRCCQWEPSPPPLSRLSISSSFPETSAGVL